MSRLKWVQLQRVPGYDQYFSLSETKHASLLIDINVKKSSVTTSTTYNEQVFVNYVTRCKIDPV